MRVKVCGIRRREDAQLAVALGASALGFVLWPHSPRAVTVDEAREITAAVPAFVTCVGVFVNQPRAEVLDMAVRAGLTGIQLHGEEDAADYAGCSLQVVKALPVSAGFSLSAVSGVPYSV